MDEHAFDRMLEAALASSPQSKEQSDGLPGRDSDGQVDESREKQMEEQLREVLKLLPEEDQQLLCFSCAFSLDDDIIRDLTGVDTPGPRMEKIRRDLAASQCLPEGRVIPDQVLKAACVSLLDEEVAALTAEEDGDEPIYSPTFYDRLPGIVPPPQQFLTSGEHKALPASPKQKKRFMATAILRRVAMVAVVALVAVSTTIFASANVRERFFRWFVQTFPTHSEFRALDAKMEFNDENAAILNTYAPTWLPEGFSISHANAFTGNTNYSYSHSEREDAMIHFSGAIPGNGTVSMNTEDSVIQEIIFKGEPAYLWERLGAWFLVWKQDGYEFFVIGEVSEEEILRIAESVHRDSGVTTYETASFRRMKAITPTDLPAGCEITEEYNIYPCRYIHYFVPDVNTNISLEINCIPRPDMDFYSGLDDWSAITILGETVYCHRWENGFQLEWSQAGCDFRLDASDLDEDSFFRIAESVISQAQKLI